MLTTPKIEAADKVYADARDKARDVRYTTITEARKDREATKAEADKIYHAAVIRADKAFAAATNV